MAFTPAIKSLRHLWTRSGWRNCKSCAAANLAPAATSAPPTPMLNRLLEIVMRQRPAVLLGTLVLMAVGVWAALRLPIDAVPDITNPQVQINTTVPALAPEEVEKL